MVNIYVKNNGKYNLQKVRVNENEMQEEVKSLLRTGIKPNQIVICKGSEINPRKMETILE